MKFHIYLGFDKGECEEAFDLYQEVFGAKIDTKMTWNQAPTKVNEGLSKEDKEKIMHMSLSIGGGGKYNDFQLMGCDQVNAGCCETKFQSGNNVHIMICPDSKDNADYLIKALSRDGGKIVNPMRDEFWGDYFGMCTDRFGIHWMICYSKTEEKKIEEDSKAED